MRTGRPKGTPHSQEWKERQSKLAFQRIQEGTWKNPFVKGKTSPRKGIELSEETKNKISQSRTEKKYPGSRIHIDVKGSKNPNYKGDSSRTKLIDRIRNTMEYSKWRLAVYTRDNFKCQNCGQLGSGNLNAHHIISLSSLIKSCGIKNMQETIDCSMLWNIDNGITLCVECHSQTESYLRGGMST